VVTDVDIRFAPVDFVSAIKFIADESKLTKDPVPYIKKEISNYTEARPEHKRNKNSWQECNHKNGENNGNPKDVQPLKERIDDSHGILFDNLGNSEIISVFLGCIFERKIVRQVFLHSVFTHNIYLE